MTELFMIDLLGMGPILCNMKKVLQLPVEYEHRGISVHIILCLPLRSP